MLALHVLQMFCAACSWRQLLLGKGSHWQRVKMAAVLFTPLRHRYTPLLYPAPGVGDLL